jgi:hypothetical protein
MLVLNQDPSMALCGRIWTLQYFKIACLRIDVEYCHIGLVVRQQDLAEWLDFDIGGNCNGPKTSFQVLSIVIAFVDGSMLAMHSRQSDNEYFVASVTW